MSELLNVLDEDFAEASGLERMVSQLLDTLPVVTRYGFNPTAVGIMNATGLLSGTALESMALESFRSGVDDHLALESIAIKIREKMSAWSARILHIVTEGMNQALSFLSKVVNPIFDRMKALSTKTWNLMDDAKHQIKAHPYKTVFAVVSAAAAVVALITLFSTSAPTLSAGEGAISTFTSRFQSAIEKIKWPFGVIKTKLSGSRIMVSVEGAVESTKVGSAAALGWSQSAVSTIGSQISHIWSIMKGKMTSFGSRVISSLKFLNDTGGDLPGMVGATVAGKTRSKLLGWAAQEALKKAYLMMLFSAIAAIYALMKVIVGKAFRMVSDTFRKLVHTTEPAQ